MAKQTVAFRNFANAPENIYIPEKESVLTDTLRLLLILVTYGWALSRYPKGEIHILCLLNINIDACIGL